MKRLILFFVTLLFIVSCNTNPEKKTVPHSANAVEEINSDLAHISFPISGMTCEIGCAARIEKKVAASEGVAAAKVDFDAKTAYVSFDPNITSFANIQSTVEKLGGDYQVGEAKASSPYNLDHKEHKQCDKTCDKPCCAEKKKCDKSCTKECCASKKEGMHEKACAADCKKACCAKKEEKV